MSTTDFPGSYGTTGPTTGTASGGSTSGAQEKAQEKAQQVAGTAADEGKHVAATARDEAQNVAAEAKTQARNLMSEATTQLDEQSRTQKDRLAGTVRTFGDDLEQMAGDQSGLASDVARQVAERARSLSSQLEGREPRELLDEVRDFARRRPGTFLLGALAAGVVAGRLTRAAQAAQSDNGSQAATPLATTRPTPVGYAAPPVVADVTTPADPLTTGADAPSSGPISGGIEEPGTATGDPLAATRPDDVGTPYPVTPSDPDAPRLDPGSRL